MKGGFGSGVSVPLLLKIEMLRRAMAFGFGWKSLFSPWKAVPSRDANCASGAISKTGGRPSLSYTVVDNMQSGVSQVCRTISGTCLC